MSRVVIKFYLNGKCISTKPMNSQDNLKTVREKLKEKISDSQQFLSKDGDLIDIDGEDSFTVGDVIDSSRIINIKETGDKKRIKLKLNDEIISTVQVDTKTKISDIRKSIQNILESAHFYTLDNEIIEKENEEQFLVEDIINNDEINLKNEKENTLKKDIVTVRIYLNGKPLIKNEFNKNSSLSDIRKKIEFVKHVPKEFVFEDQEGFKILTDKEQKIKLTSILYDNKINITIEVSDTSLNDTTIISEPNIPIKGSKRLENHEKGKLKIYLYPNEPFNPKDENDAIAILVVGQTGSGKTTLLNSFINALHGIKITDDFRYIIINEDNLKHNRDQSKSQTTKVSIYNIKRTKRAPPIKIIDTPGFGDTRGIEHDKEIIKQIKEKFETEVLDLNAICFVAKSSNARLTLNQQYIFGNIINLFGKDMKKNFIAMLTFCDGKTPQVINALQSQDCIFSTIIPYIDKPWYLKFNNSAIYSDNTEDLFTQMFWKLGMKSFDEFIEKLIKLPRKSLEKSRENEIEHYCEQFYLNRDKVNNNQNFTFPVNIIVQKKVDLKRGEYVTNCLVCNRTCHYPCYIEGDIKKRCYCIGDNECCNVCKCHYTHHANSSYRFEYITETKQQTAQEIFERYNEGKEGVASAENLLKKLEEEYYKIQMDCYDKEVEIIECINRLSSIALNGKINSSNEYLDLLIESENEEKKTGYKERIEGYKELKQTNQIIDDVMKNSITKKSKEEIMNELKQRKNDIKEGQKSTLDKNCSECVIC
ncbi:hypothetical protein, conserved [Entamoeba dispar SAW760]|uniref:G domain-containing protein n=1 Tax=Entamoeba dispar (strain ATCC PRA-260 / SAW760) TaxID=370354 RepID=B0ER63_ENTDS|nr:uncharacterized protein EDI_184910 [Entamoeba dispar SAW760]EDR22965.1 hypothetical protein, conserved [Entamoeba dispar SAW760]|eukprot:EDR22965.1 hypothetical protein, conserved [Entamoeba dispar SAW760]